MSNIDWGKAPFTATHYGSGKFWRMHDSGNCWEKWLSYGWACSGEAPMAFIDYCERPQTQPKPPVIAQVASNTDDPVNHPRHYQIAPEVEAIDIIRASLTPEQFKGYLLGNFLKYRLRAGDKGDLNQDIEKSNWYRERLSGN